MMIFLWQHRIKRFVKNIVCFSFCPVIKFGLHKNKINPDLIFNSEIQALFYYAINPFFSIGKASKSTRRPFSRFTIISVEIEGNRTCPTSVALSQNKLNLVIIYTSPIF